MAFLPIPLVKMSGAGNTFVLVDATKTSTWLDIEANLSIKRRSFVKMICDRTLGVSADGVLFLQEGEDGCDYTWDFYNADGSNAEMCGNAARCAALFVSEYLSSSLIGTYKFKTGAGPIVTQVLGDERVRVHMPIIKDYQEHKTLMIEGKPYLFSFVNSGVPHLVMELSSYKQATELKEFAKEARQHKDLAPSGANITFYVKEKEGVLKAVTFERGVEDYTQACGTGAVAAAYVDFKKFGNRNLDVHMPGGTLSIQISTASENPLMTGDAVFVMEFQYFYEVVR
ncbi:MAG: diaminopimelate epimerase [Pseudobdellovibrionaceae bacterium]